MKEARRLEERIGKHTEEQVDKNSIEHITPFIYHGLSASQKVQSDGVCDEGPECSCSCSPTGCVSMEKYPVVGTEVRTASGEGPDGNSHGAIATQGSRGTHQLHHGLVRRSGRSQVVT